MISDDLLGFTMDRYGFHRDSLRFVAAGRESTRRFYQFSKQETAVILRVEKCHGSQIGQTTAEMHWLRYLAREGMPVSDPLEADDGTLTSLTETGDESYILSAFSKVEGRPWDKDDPALWNQKVFYQWGKTMGDLHRVTKDYMPAHGQERRPEFQSIILDTVRAFPSVHSAAENLMDEIKALPKDRQSYGLIHCDLHPNNFLIDGERINVFDFADCAYGWYALDIGVALSVGLWLGRFNSKGYDFAEDILHHFIKGYLTANTLDDFWLAKIPLFMRLCQIAGFSCTYEFRNPDDDQQREDIYHIEHNMFLKGCSLEGIYLTLKAAREATTD